MDSCTGDHFCFWDFWQTQYIEAAFALLPQQNSKETFLPEETLHIKNPEEERSRKLCVKDVTEVSLSLLKHIQFKQPFPEAQLFGDPLCSLKRSVSRQGLTFTLDRNHYKRKILGKTKSTLGEEKRHLGKTNGSGVALLKKLFQGDAEMFLGSKISQVWYSSIVFAFGSYSFCTVLPHFRNQNEKNKLPRQWRAFYSFFNLVLKIGETVKKRNVIKCLDLKNMELIFIQYLNGKETHNCMKNASSITMKRKSQLPAANHCKVKK